MPEREEDFEALLAEFEQKSATRRDPNVGDKVDATVVSISNENVFVDLGSKFEGTMDRADFTDADGKLTVAIGDTVTATVVKKDDRSGTLVLRSRIGRSQGSEELEQAAANGLPVEGLVSAVNKGGVEVQIAGLRAFCPMSQLDTRFVEDPEQYVGQRLTFQITRYEGGRRPNIVLSRRALLEEDQRARAEETRARLEPGAILPGTVTSLKDYGAFIDIGGLEGMVHISELGYGRVNHPKDVLHVGQQLEAVVLKIEKTGDPRRPEKIALSVRALEADPWQDVDQRFPVGTRMQGTVTRVQPFGAFVELAPGVEGLVHISELGAGRRVNHPREIVSPGNTVEVSVLSIDLDQRRISLSMKSAQAEAEDKAEQEAFTSYNQPKQSLGTFGDLLSKSIDKKK